LRELRAREAEAERQAREEAVKNRYPRRIYEFFKDKFGSRP